MRLRQMILQSLLFLCMVAILFYGFHVTQTQVDEKDIEHVKEAIQKAALECYSVEGKYPTDLQYLEDKYGLYLQKDMYQVRYEFIADNIMPETNVFVRGDKE